MLSDIEIVQKAGIKPVERIAAKLRINKKYLIPYGKNIAKIDLKLLERLKGNPRSKYIVVTAITPTPLGEGKTVTTIGLSMALNKLGKSASVCIRQPSSGPVFGIKGGAAGGGYSQVLPMEDFNLHFTGDNHAVSLAHNLASAFLDNSIFKGNPLNINPKATLWRRVIDINDRSLRNIKIGFGFEGKFEPQDSGFDITASSEIMAALALAVSISDLRKRLGKIVLAYTYDEKPVTCEDIKVAGSMAALLKEAIKPNLIQTIENTPCFVHAGPFGNIAHGNNSILADKIALATSDYTVTESGFGADCGAEKFFDIKCRASGFVPSCAVMVCSVRALKAHSGKFSVTPGKPLDKNLFKEDLPSVEAGIQNLAKQIENVKLFGVPVVVAINRFNSDTDKEINFIKAKALEFGADGCEISEVWLKGSSGGLGLGRAVIKAAEKKNDFKFLYPLDASIKEKISVIASKVYGAKNVEYSALAEEKIARFTKQGWDKLPVCMTKTHLSLSHDPTLLGRPKDFILPIRDIRAFIGAGFLSPMCGAINTMPGLPTHPAGEKIDIDGDGNIVGLF
ncbi:MAG: formate--tetrahydrofolate ligase [Candidatus Omnitrophica bacterium]|nr:formate--tetrahydrofolate ligase [Candidatus Omnitrophota bacterium]